MKIVLYSGQTVVKVIKNVKNPLVTSTGIYWEGDSLNEINLPFLLLDDNVEVSEITDAVISQDKKSQYTKRNLEQENEDLRQQLAATNADLMGLMEYVFGGGQ